MRRSKGINGISSQGFSETLIGLGPVSDPNFNENAKNSLRSWRRDELAWREVMQRMHERKRDKGEKRILSS